VDLESVRSADVQPAAGPVHLNRAVVLETGSHKVRPVLCHADLVHLSDAHAVGDVDVGRAIVGRLVDPAITRHDQLVAAVGHAVDVGVNLVRGRGAEPMSTDGPIRSTVGGLPDVDAAHDGDVGVGRTRIDAEVVPALSITSCSGGGVAEQIG